MTTEKPKPCPFCGGDAELYPLKLSVAGNWAVGCSLQCDTGPFVFGFDELLVVAKWNHRPREAALEIRAEGLQGIIREFEAGVVKWAERAKKAEAELAQARAAAVQWVTYDGTAETLPDRDKEVLACGHGFYGVAYLVERRGNWWWDFDIAMPSEAVFPGHRWAYLPIPPAA